MALNVRACGFKGKSRGAAQISQFYSAVYNCSVIFAELEQRHSGANWKFQDFYLNEQVFIKKIAL